MQIRFDDKTAIVTGGARGIGLSIAGELASSGASVVILDVSADGVREAVAAVADRGGVALGYSVDVADFEAITNATREAVTQTGRLDILVNCAGRAGSGSFREGDQEAWKVLIAVNLLGTIHSCHAAIPYLIERGAGRIINIASDSARIGSGGEAVYSAAKGGVISLTKSLARELARHRITVNCVSPGPTDTPMLREFSAQAGGIVDKLVEATPLRRLAEPEDIASAVAFLASDPASHITGQVLSVSGGLTMV